MPAAACTRALSRLGSGPLRLAPAARHLSSAPPSAPLPPAAPSAAERAALLALLSAQPSLAPAALEHIFYAEAMRGSLPAEARRRFLAKAMDGDELREEFARADTDADGRISWREFSRWGEDLVASSGARPEPPRPSQLGWHFVRSALPFVGFGFVDNGLMVLTGEAIDSTFGAMLGISTMAAAALGNATSNVIGMGAHGTVERSVSRLGVPNPRLTAEQLRLPRVHALKVLGGAVGVFTGCILGMVPLLFLSPKGRDDAAGEAEPARAAT